MDISTDTVRPFDVVLPIKPWDALAFLIRIKKISVFEQFSFHVKLSIDIGCFLAPGGGLRNL